MDRPQWYADGGSSRSGGFPPLRTWTFTAQLTLVLVVFLFLDLVLPITSWLALHPARLAENLLFAYQLLTYALVHAQQQPLHLIINVLVLFFFGRDLELYIGRRRYMGFCAAAALCGSVVYLAVEALRAGPAPTLLGASAVVTACMVTYAIYWPRREILLFFVLPIQVWVVAALFVGMDLYFGAAYLFTNAPSATAHFAHLGGALVGAVYALRGDQLARRAEGALERWRSRRETARRRQHAERRAEVDRLLEKISRDGISSLSRAERRYLEEASRDLRNRR